MARHTRSNKLFSSDFVKAIKAAVNDHLDKTDMETCVSADTIASHKAVAKAFSVTHPVRLRLLVQTAVSEGQVSGLSSRQGRVGGIHRVTVKAKPVTKKTTAKVENDTTVVTAEAVGV
jgi:hypothetical protein